MSKVLRAVGKIAGVVATVAAVIPGGQAIAAIAGAVATISSVGAQLTARKPPARGSTSVIQIGATMPIPYAMGRTYAGGNLIRDMGFGATLKKVPNPYRALTIVYSGCGPIHSFESFQADFTTVPLSGNAATGYYAGFLSIARQLGASPEAAALLAQWAGEPGWGATSKLSGFAAAKYSLLFDRDGKIFAGGIPQFGAILKGVKVYDPRLDSTYPGGSGTQRIASEATWAWSENPALHALAYAYGRRQNGKKVFGVDLGSAAINLAAVVAWANVCDANGWKIGGTIFEPGDKWDNLKRICAAGSAEPTFSGGVLTFKYNAPRTALDTITIDDLADGEIIVPAMRGARTRVNGIVPLYRSEAHMWEMVQSSLVQVATYVAEDGEERTEQLPFELVQNANQAAVLASYELVDRREFGPFVLPCKPRLFNYHVGDALTVNLPEAGLANQLAVITGRTIDAATGIVTLEFMSETAAKHAFALGQTGTAPPTPALVPPADRDMVANLNFWNGLIDVPAGRVFNNLLDMTPWVPGGPQVAGCFGRFVLNQSNSPSENILSLEPGPFGTSEPCIKSVAAGGNGAGGWGYNLYADQGFDPAQSFQLTVWVRQMQGDGTLYFGTGADGGGIVSMAGAADGNPYFWSGDLPVPGKWYLLVGNVHGFSYTGADSGLSGVWDPDTGKRVLAGTDFKLGSATPTYLVHRMFQYYCGAIGSTSYFARPRLDLANGNQPSIPELMSPAALLNANQKWSDITGAGVPDNYATSADNLIADSIPAAGSPSWSLSGPVVRQAGAAGDPIPACFKFPGGGGAMQARANNGTLIPLLGERKLYVSSWAWKSGTPTGTLSIVVDFFDAAGAAIAGSQQVIDIKPAAASTWSQKSAALTGVPANAASFKAYYSTSGPSADMLAGGLRIAKTEPAADVTARSVATVNGNTDFAIDANYQGAITTPLPLTRQLMAFEGTTDVSANSTFVLSGGFDALGLTVNNTPGSASRGTITVGINQITATTTPSTGNGTATLTVTTPNGSVVVKTLKFTKTNASPPVNGGTGATSAEIHELLATTSVTAQVLSGEVIVRSDAAGKIKVAMDIAYTAGNSLTLARTMSCNLAYATTSGGALTDLFADTVPSRTPYSYIAIDYSYEDGSIFLPLTQFTLPAANTDYYFKVKGRSSSSTRLCVPTGVSIFIQQV